jgi:hypothetical protein
LVKVASIVALAALLTAAPAGARQVTAGIVTGEQPREVRTLGGAGLYVPGQGLYVSRQEALARLGRLPAGGCDELERCPYELFVSVPPLGAQPNTRPYDVTILGGGYRGILVSPNTRIDGLVSIADIRETVRALEEGEEPPIRWRASADPLGELAALTGRLDDARRAQGPANVALTLVLVALVAAALVVRRALVARAGLVFAPAAILLALAVAALERVGPVTTTVAVLAAAPLALAVARFVPLTLVVALFLGLYGLVLAWSPETNSLMALGPHPWSGGRFYGVTNQVETLLLAPTLAAATLLRGWKIVALGLLALVVVGASETGADGGGVVVVAAAFAVLWFLLERRTITPLAALAAAAAALAFVGLDALTGGSSHVVDAVAEGPGYLLDVFERRLETSGAIATSTVWQLGLVLAGLGILGWLAFLRPRFAVVDAFLVAVALSLLLNDSPTKVAGYGALMGAGLRAWSVSRERRLGIDSAA